MAAGHLTALSLRRTEPPPRIFLSRSIAPVATIGRWVYSSRPGDVGVSCYAPIHVHRAVTRNLLRIRRATRLAAEVLSMIRPLLAILFASGAACSVTRTHNPNGDGSSAGNGDAIAGAGSLASSGLAGSGVALATGEGVGSSGRAGSPRMPQDSGSAGRVGRPGAGAGGAGQRAEAGRAAAGSPSSAGASAGSSGSSCSAPPPASALVGWAAVQGSGSSGNAIATTSGGGDAMPVTVTTLAALNSAAGGTAPAVIYVKGVIAPGSVKVGSNKTIVGLCGAELHGHVDMNGSVNVIVRNLKVVGYNCSDSPSECKSGADAISVVNAAHHLWFDHDDISDGSDGNLDITNGSDFVTVSFTKFWYSTKRTDPGAGSTGHRFSNLIGAADGLAIDQGHLNVTWHHNWWANNVAERMPRSRDGKIHVVNNLFTAEGNDYCTNSGNMSSLLVENNVYIGVHNPLQEDADGNMLARGNVFQNTKGTATSGGTGFSPPYRLTVDDTTNLAAIIMAQAGPQ